VSLSASWELQKAIHAALVDDAPLASFVDARIYDRPPDDVAFPFVTIGDAEVSPGETSGCAIHKLTLISWSRKNGRRETKEIVGAIHDRLNNATLTLSGHSLVSLQFEQAVLSHVPDADALSGKIRFRAFTQTNS
jgi:uncharacterized protein DUF3168